MLVGGVFSFFLSTRLKGFSSKRGERLNDRIVKVKGIKRHLSKNAVLVP